MLTDPLIGQQLANFRLDRLLGRGGMGQVYYAWDIRLQRPVAVKVIDTRYRSNREYARRFIEEARVVATWRHENIIQVYFAGQEDELYYFVMEYLEGQSLSDLLEQYVRQGRLLPAAEVLRIGHAIASALDYAHSRSVVHRDVKPQNVLIANDGRVVLTDFGLALHADRGSQGEVLGSVHYTAPEQARRSSGAVPQSDLYSLGIILFEMLTGMTPFDDPSPTSIAIQHITQPPPSPCILNPALSPEIERVLFKALHKQPEARYPSGKGLMAALQKAIGPCETQPVASIDLPPLPAVVLNDPQPQHASTPPLAGAAAQGEGVSDRAEAQDPLIGKFLDEYRLMTLIGRGGMGRVYRAYDTQRGRPAAVKVIDPTYRAHSAAIERFEREARAISALNHPNIIQLYHQRLTGEMFYLAMQFVEGDTLNDRLENHRHQHTSMTEDEILQVVSEITEALDYMHGRGVIHRDLKPANVLLDQAGHVVLTDFGLALITDVGTRGEIFGSPHYMAPEQIISSANASPRSDMYALGVMLYEMFTGQLPFQAAEPLDVAMQHMTANVPPPRQLRPEISPAVEKVILQALAKEPKERYKDGAVLLQALAAALGKEVVVRDVLNDMWLGDIELGVPLTLPPELEADGFGAPQSEPVSQTEGWVQPVRNAWQRLPAAFRPWLSLLVILLLAGGIVLGLTRLDTVQLGTLPGASPPAVGLHLPSEAVSGTLAVELPAAAGLPTASSVPEATRPQNIPQPTATRPALASPVSAPTNVASPEATNATGLQITPPPHVRALRTEDHMPMMLVTGNTFLMGAANDDPNAEFDERPQHKVTLDSFYMDQYEVSVAQYVNFLNFLGKHWGDACLASACASTQRETPYSHVLYDGVRTYQAEPGYENYPINNVTWYGAQAYCEWVEARLPTEAEWEFAARGWGGWLYPWGNEAPDETRAVFGQTDFFTGLKPVEEAAVGGSFFGIQDMAGSLWEWVADYFMEDAYASAPAESTNPTGPPGRYRTPRVLRGGSYASDVVDLRTTARKGAEPLVFKLFGEDVGFRCVRPAK